VPHDTSLLDGADTPLISGVVYFNPFVGATETALYAYA
jgi:hypothetical protein